MAEIDSPGITVAPLADAVANITRRTPLPTYLRSAELAQLPLALRESAQLSATVENLRYLQHIQDQATKAVSLTRRGANGEGAYVTREKFTAELQAIGRQAGLTPQDGTIGTLRDPTSLARTRLIYDIQTQRAAEYARWLRDQDPTRLKFYPCQELIRIADRNVPRDWQARWLAEGGKLYTGRMIAAKDAKIWTGISRFRTPWPPFDFNSGMGLRDISRSEAEKLGVLKKDEEVKPGTAKFNDDLQASVKDISPEYRQGLKDTFGDQIVIDGDTVQWQGNVIADLVRKTIDDPQWNGQALKLGEATPQTIKKTLDAGLADLTGYQLELDPGIVRKNLRDHGVNGKRKDPFPITPKDFELIPHVWREPDFIEPGEMPGDYVFSKTLLGRLIFAAWTRSVKTRKLVLKSLYRNK